MIVLVVNFLKQKVLPIVLLMLVASCNSIDVTSPYLAARPFQQYAAKADAWLLQAQNPSGILPFYYRPSLARADAKNSPMGQLIAAERLTRLGKERPQARTASQAQHTVIAQSWPHLSEKIHESHRAQITLGEFALSLRVSLLQPNSAGQQAHLDRQAALLRASFNAETGFPEKLFPAATDSSFRQRYFTGHAALSLLQHSAATDDANSLNLADAALTWLSTQYPASNKANFHPTIAPWHALAIAAHYQRDNASSHLDTLFTISDQLIDLQSDPEFPGRFFTDKGPNFGNPNVVRDALSTLTLMASLDIATDLGDRKRKKRYRKAIWLALDNLRSLQYDHGVVTNFDQPMKAVGALRFRHNDEMIRLDGVVFGAEVFERAAIMIQNGRL